MRQRLLGYRSPTARVAFLLVMSVAAAIGRTSIAESPFENAATTKDGGRASGTEQEDFAKLLNEFEEVVQGVAGSDKLTMEELRGKPVVVDFWATWCAPCVLALPHMNELAKDPQLTEIQFIAVSADDNAESVRQFLKKLKIAGAVAVDSDRSTWSAFDVRAIPLTIVFDRAGNVVGRTHPGQLTRESLLAVLKGEIPVFPEDNRLAASPGFDPFAPTAFRDVPSPVRIVIRHSLLPGGSSLQAVGDTKVTFLGATQSQLLSHAFGLPESRVQIDGPELDQRYDLVAAIPGTDAERLKDVLKDLVPDALGVSTAIAEKPINVWTLTRSERADARIRPSASSQSRASSKNGGIVMKAQPMSTLIAMLDSFLDGSVEDETKLSRTYDIDLTWKTGDVESLRNALADKYGLSLTMQRRPLTVLSVVRKGEGALP